MPSKRKFTARFPTARIKKIMQLDEEIGKVAATVPPVVSRALELFLEDLLTKTLDLAAARGSKTITPSHMKHVIESEPTFNFAKKLVDSVPELKLSTQMSIDSTTGDGDESNLSHNNNSTTSNAPKRGRPKKHSVVVECAEESSTIQSEATLEDKIPKKRKRRKRKGSGLDEENLNNSHSCPVAESAVDDESDLPIDLSINNHKNSIKIESP